MFYDHDILTSKKHGVATIWLVATLGSRSTLKKVTRKAILDVEIAQACETIITPEAPMALRLQGSLLYGVSRVFSQQCGYILADAESLRGKMRGISVILRDLQTDHTIGTTRIDQLNMQDDPDFNIDFDFSLDMTAFGLQDTSSRSSEVSPRTLDSSQSSLPIDEPDEPGLDLPSMDMEDLNYSDLGPGMGTSSAAKSARHHLLSSVMNEPAVYDNSDFQINEDGDIMIFGEDEAPVPMQSAGIVPSVSGLPDDAAIIGLAPANYQTGVLDQGQEDLNLSFEDDIVPANNDEPPIPSLSRLSPLLAHEQQRATPAQLDEEIEATAEAPQRRGQGVVLPLEFDDVAELSNGHLAVWNTHYLANMKTNDEERVGRRALAQAKRNAAFWVLEQGVGGVQVNYGEDLVPHPFAVFSGQTLLDALTGTEPAAGRKRSLSTSSGDSEDKDRRVRSRSEGQQVGRGDDALPVAGDEDGILPADDFPESELGRRAGSSLRDRSSQMPWNLSSRQGSARPHGSSLRGISSSVGGHGGPDLGPHSDVPRRRSRMMSASPLVGRGRQLSHPSSIDPRDQTIFTDFNIDEFGDIDDQLAGNLDDNFQLYGPATVVSTQTAAQSKWLATALEQEAHNFLDFLHTSIQGTLQDQDAAPTTTFSSLLPPETNSKAVGAQGLLHVLALATKGLIEVDQMEAFGDIRLGIVVSDLDSASSIDPEVVEIEA